MDAETYNFNGMLARFKEIEEVLNKGRPAGSNSTSNTDRDANDNKEFGLDVADHPEAEDVPSPNPPGESQDGSLVNDISEQCNEISNVVAEPAGNPTSQPSVLL